MRLHRLEITAFGPFAGHEVIDFDRLNEAGVFLLNGETGAGKTSILDAICFALYSSAPTPATQGGRRPERSDHAEAHTAPRVELEFSASERRWHICRCPSWSEPSTRAASGWAERKSSVLLREYVDGHWVERAHRPDEVAGYVQHVVGLSREQFTQVMMLPQGQFARFLRAGSREREELLETLFGTEIYPQVQQELAERALAAERERDALTAGWQAHALHVRSLADQLANAWPAPETQESAPTGTEEPIQRATGEPTRPEATHAAGPEHEDPAAQLAQLVHTAAARESELERRRAVLTRRTHEASERHRELLTTRQRWRRWCELETVRAQLEAQAPAMQRLREALRGHEAAYELRAPDAALTQARRHRERSFEHAAHCRAALSNAESHEEFARVLGEDRELLAVSEPDAPLVPEVADRVQRVLEAAIRAREAAHGAREDETELTDRGRELDELTATVTSTEAAMHEARESGAQLEHRRTQIAERREQLRGAVTDPDDAARIAARAAEVLELTRSWAEREADARELDAGYEAAERRRRESSAAVEALETARFAHAAASLAANLSAGQPCPVCGGTEHPDPVTAPAGEAVGDAELAEARSARERAQHAVDEARNRCLEAHAAVRDVLERGALTDLSRAQREHEQARERAETAQRTIRELAALDSEAAAVAEQVEQAAQRRDELARTLSGVRARLEHVRDAHDRLTRRVAQLRGGFTSVSEREAAAQRLVSAAEACAQAIRRAREAHDALESAQRQLNEAAAASPFSNAQAARAALLETNDKDEYVRRIDEHRDRATALEAELASPALRDLANLDPEQREHVGASVTEHRVHEAARELDAAQRDLARVTEAYGSVGAVRRAADELTRESQRRTAMARELDERCRVLRGLADAANGRGGDNALRMTLTSFVLAARLERVADVASQHLDRMSSGRYGLRHTDRARGGGKAGLGLEIDDAWTGVRRGTETLSGGESFFTSLALALALADVVREEAGGTEMDTLFVDEGFGSLDETTLEHVLETVDGLRRNGRVIGLVSHVHELKQRIPAQLVVTKTPVGSHVRVSVGGP